MLLFCHVRCPFPSSINGPRWLQELQPFNIYSIQQGVERRGAAFLLRRFPRSNTHILHISEWISLARTSHMAKFSFKEDGGVLQLAGIASSYHTGTF